MLISQRHGEKFNTIGSFVIKVTAHQPVRSDDFYSCRWFKHKRTGYQETVQWFVGDDNKIYFWEDIWNPETPIQDFFPKIYRISRLKHNIVAKIYNLWKECKLQQTEYWTRPLIERDESDLLGLESLLRSVVLRDKEDMLCWVLEAGVSSTKKWRELLFEMIGCITIFYRKYEKLEFHEKLMYFCEKFLGIHYQLRKLLLKHYAWVKKSIHVLTVAGHHGREIMREIGIVWITIFGSVITSHWSSFWSF